MRQHILSLSAFILCSTAAFAQSQTVGELRISDNDATPASRQNVILQAPASSTLTANQTLVLPGTTPSSGQVLTVQSVAGSAATLTWGTPASAWGLTGNAGTNSGTNFLGTTDNISLRLRTNNAERMVVDSTGNVGIGTATPGEKLHVAGNILSQPVVAADAAIYLRHGSIAVNNGFEADITSNMKFLTAGAEKMRITSGGNVEIGTTTANTVASATSGSTAAQQLARLTVTGGDASINGVTVGTGGGQIGSNTAIGNRALYANTTGYENTATGLWSLYTNTTGFSNTANGVSALFFNTSGNKNTAVGESALYSNTTGDNNTANGFQSLYANTTGVNNTAIGSSALYYNTTGYNNTANGYQSLVSNTTGYANTANGYAALYSNTTGYGNAANGVNALYSNTTGVSNTANGANALYYNTTGDKNAAYGFQSLYSNTIGTYNTASGYQSLFNNTTGNQNTANGFGALYSNTTGSQNTSNGYYSLSSNTTGSSNAANGMNALYSNTTGNYNTANGATALNANTTGNYNTANGMQALYDQTTGDYNTSLGYNTGRGITTGRANTILGAQVNGLSAGLSNNIIIADGDGNRRINVDATGNVGIGTTSPAHKLDVVGTAGLSTGTAWTNTSDMRLKENVKPYTRGLSEILKINPIYYSYTENSGLKNDPKYGQNIGISAQELRQIIPEAIATKEHMMKDGTVLKDALELTKADAMWFALINAVKELKAENDALKSSLSKSELKSEATAAKLEMIEAALSAQGINFGKTASK